MRVRVKLFATLSRDRPGVSAGVPFEVELDDGATIQGLLRELRLPEGEVKVVFVHGRAREWDWRLSAGDELGIFPLVGGG
jgi:sulfur-carrier protein